MKIGLISDTHGTLRPRVLEVFEGVDMILHAGDIGDLDIITELEALAPVHAVHGNTDHHEITVRYGDPIELTLAGVRITVTHGHRLGAPTPPLLREHFPDSDVVIYGHTHVPLFDRKDVPILINPGAAGPARFKLKPSVALLELPDIVVTHIPL